MGGIAPLLFASTDTSETSEELDFYISNSTVDNVVRSLMLSDECQTKMLKKTTIQFIDENEKNVLLKNESSFDVLKQPAPYLLVDI